MSPAVQLCRLRCPSSSDSQRSSASALARPVTSRPFRHPTASMATVAGMTVPTTTPTADHAREGFPSSTPPFFAASVEVGHVAPPSSSRADGSQQQAEDERCQDVGNAVLWEHLNLEVPDLEVARLFFGEGLGLTADPSTTGAQRGGAHVMWYNCGKQQFHIARGPSAQRLPPGSVVGLVLPNVAAVAERLEAVKQLLGDVSLTYARGDTLEAVDPYGNIFAVHSSLPYFPGRAGIAYLQLPCFPGTAKHIAAFYASRMGARCRISANSAGASSAVAAAGSGVGRGQSQGHGGPVRAEVWLGPGQKLVFVEQTSLGPVSEQAVSSLFGGWHIAMYVADFSRTYTAVHHPDRLPFNDHPYRDHYHSLADALRNRQFRFLNIVASAPDPAVAGKAAASEGPQEQQQLEPGQLVYRISHEVRSLHHSLYSRPLYGRETGFV